MIQDDEKRELVRQAMSILGSAKSPLKAAKARENAKRSWTPKARKVRLQNKTSKTKTMPTDGIKMSPPAIP